MKRCEEEKSSKELMKIFRSHVRFAASAQERDMQTSRLDIGKLIGDAEKILSEKFREIDAVASINHRRVLTAMRTHRLTEEFFAEKTGYGMHDKGREVIDMIFADALQAEAAAVRMHFVSGTHAIATALFGNLSHGQKMVSLTGKPYDTMLSVIGLPDAEPGTLRAAGVEYEQLELDPHWIDDETLFDQLEKSVVPPCAVTYIQKSRGYSFQRRTLSNSEIGKLATAVKKVNPHCLVIVDNCYGEFVEACEPTSVGADLIAGSLIKNPGGGLAICGGYVAGRQAAVDSALNRLTAPGIGGHLGLTFNQNRLLMQGLFLAPNVVAESVKGVMLFAQTLMDLGLTVKPDPLEMRFDVIQAVEFKTEPKLVAFCRAIQRCSPVNSHVAPEPSEMPGYPDPVVMAAGTFIDGATIELSADGPIRPPFAGFIQGGLSYLHVKCVLEETLNLCVSGEFPFL
jgi:cystathionine beta-lyase family protein involved in aluminum resistance